MSDDLEALKVTASIDKTTSMLRRYNITKGRGGYPQSLELYAVQNVLDALTDALAEVKRLRSSTIGLNAALDAYWNVGPKERGTGGTIKAIEAAQQACRAALTQQSQAGGDE